MTQTVLDVESVELRQALESGSLVVAIERSPTDDHVVACGDVVSDAAPG